jgi:hypothetical protein
MQRDARGIALACIARGWPVFPWGRRTPLTSRGQTDATLDADLACNWWTRWPDAVPAIRTGAVSGVVGLDIDVGHGDGANGWDSLDEIGISLHPHSPTCHTPRGGSHVLFAHPGAEIDIRSGRIAPGLDLKGDRGSIILAPGRGRWWDDHLPIDIALAPLPDALRLADEAAASSGHAAAPRPARPVPLSRYGEAALDSAVKAIVAAPAGEQHDTLNREIYSIARLVAGGVMPAGLAIEALSWAARQMPSYDLRRPWRPAELDKLVRGSFADGLAHPRQPAVRG